MKPAMTPQQEQLTSAKESPIALYKKLAVGNGSWLHLLCYETAMLFLSGIPGLLGLAGRSIFYPGLFASCGRRPGFGRGVSIRQPRRITLGNRVLIDDYAVLDVRNSDASITLGDFVSVGRFSTITAKTGAIKLGSGVNVGSYTRIATQSSVEIGESTLISAYCYIGPGNHSSADPDKPLISQEMEIRGGVKLGSHVWVGAHSTILDGVTIGDNSIVGAHSLVRESVPANCVVAGVPAKVIRQRD